MNKVKQIISKYAERAFHCTKRSITEFPHIFTNSKQFGMSLAINSYLIHVAPTKKRSEKYNDCICQFLENNLSGIIQESNKREYIVKKNDSLEWPVWICWFTGIENSPDVVRACFASVQRFLPAWAKIHVITLNNYSEYFELPAYCIEKYERGVMSAAALSDIFRASLLSKYGGLWLDSTILACKPISDEILRSQFFTLRAHESLPYWKDPSEGKWCNFIWNTQPDNVLFTFLRNSLLKYWQEYDTVIEYLLPDYIIKVAYDNIPSVRLMLDTFPSNVEDIWLCMRSMGEPFTDKLWAAIEKNSTFHKLTYKIPWEKVDHTGAKTVFGHILQTYLK